MNKFDIRICSCGRIHTLPSEKINNAIEHNKDFLYICGGCGIATVIGADEGYDFYDDNICYDMYSRTLPKEDTVFDTDFINTSNQYHKQISEIFYSNGYKVPMKSGMDATDFYVGKFSDRWHPDFYKIQRNDVTVDEIMDFIDDFNKNRTTVDMERLIDRLPEDVLEELSALYIPSLDWANTKYDKFIK